MRLFIGLFVCFVGISACVGMADERNTFTGALPEGVTVELVGVRHFDARYLDRTPGKPFPWWRPDGTPLADSPDTRRDLGVGGATHQFLMRIAGDPSCNGRAIGPLDRYLSVDLATQKAPGFEKDDLRRFRLRFPSEQKQADVTVALATGQWEVADSWRLGPTWTPYNGLLGSCDRIILRCPEQKDADVVAEVTQVITDRATRLVLFDKDGQWHVSEGEIGGEGVGLVRHIYRYENLDYSQVDRIEFQARPYDYWITFRNVSLAAGYRTQVEVSIKKPGSLLPGSQLPSFDGIEIDLPEETDSRPLLFCFFDLQQRPSRNCVVQLASQSEAFKEKGLTIVAVQTSRVARPELDMWIKDNHISFLVGTVRADEEKTRFTWGVKSLPWLILTDKDHRVCAEGFPVDQLDGILAQSAEIKK